jgi:hypothetical protein
VAFTFVTITHTFETAEDLAAAGTVQFTPVEPMYNDVTVVEKAVTATLNASGALSQQLAANTDPETLPTGTTYRVTEKIVGQDQLTYYVQVPHNQGSPIDLRTLAGWQGGGTGGAGTVTAINGEGHDGTGNVVVSADDVGAQPADADLTGLAELGDGVPVRASGAWAVATGTRNGTNFLRDDGTWQSASGSSYTDEQVRDVIGTALVAGSNVTLTVNDPGDTITIAAATSGSSGIPASTVDAKGDLIVGTADDTVARRSVGTNGQALLADSAQTTGVAWGAPTPAAHNHAASEITSGTVATARLGSGTASATTFLRGDQAYADPNLLSPPVHAVGNSGASLTIDASSASGWVKTITLTANCTVTLTGATSGRVTTLELYLTQDGTGSRTVTWPAAVKWDGGAAPSLSTAAGAVDCVVLRTVNAGTSWLANLAGKGYA